MAFLRHNPFILQTNKLSVWIVLLFGAVAMALSFTKEKEGKAVIEKIALLLAGMMAIYLLQNWIEDGWSIIIFHDAIDLAYISCALPFISLGFASNAINS